MAKTMQEAELPPRAGDERLSAEALLKISIFSGLKAAALERPPGAVVLRRYQPGEVICTQGEPGWTAFYILKTEDLLAVREAQGDRTHGELNTLRERVRRLEAAADPAQRAKATVFLHTPQRRASTALRKEGLLARGLKRVFGVKPTGSGTELRSIPIDGPVDLDFQTLRDTLYEGEVFGEMSCLNRTPRSATVKATEECYILEMLRNILELLQKNKAFKEQMLEVYRRRVLNTHLRGLPIFSDVPEEVLAELNPRLELVEKEPGEVIFKEGDAPDGIYVIRIGMVKVTQKAPGGERVLAYRGRGEYVGEIGVVFDQPRMATCTALDHPAGEAQKKRRPGRAELVRIKKDDLLDLCTRFPDLKRKIEEIAEQRLADEPQPPAGHLPVVSPSGRFDELGLWQGQRLMLIDLQRCTRCDECVRACADTHADGLARIFREGPRFGGYLIPASCRQCHDPVCMIGCPVGSIHKGRAGEIIIEDWCIGCEICANQCPYDAIAMHEMGTAAEGGDAAGKASRQAVVCDQCSSLSGIPSCVYACPHDAALRVDAGAFFAGQIKMR